MPTWIKFRTKEKPFYDPRTGKVLPSIEGRRNRPKVDPFEGGGKVYPEDALKMKRLSWQEKGTTLMLLVDESQEEIDRIKAMSGEAEYRASPKKVRKYDLSEHAPVEKTNAEALEDLKREIGLPDGTTLDDKGVPVIPEDETVTSEK